VREQHAEYLKTRGFREDELKGISALGFPNLMGFGPGSGGAPNPATGQFNMENMFDGFTKQRVLADHRFAMEHPMMPVEQFRTEMLVGSGQSFFGSTSSSTGVTNGTGKAKRGGRRSGP
jgi:hypothetical protein